MKQLERLVIENFQSHGFTEIGFAPGFNVIVGASDQGKSAIIRALKWLFFNEPRGSDFIRVGATGCRVTVFMNDGTVIARERTPTKNRYYLQLPGQEEEVYEGFGNRVPWEVQRAAGLAKVQLDEGLEVMLNLGEQLEAPFLLAETGSVKAKAMGRFYGVHIVDAALRDTVRDMTRAQQEERRLQEQLAEVCDRLKQFTDLPRLAAQIAATRAKLEQLTVLAGQQKTYESLQKDLAMVKGHISQEIEVLRQLDQIPQAGEMYIAAVNLWSRLGQLTEKQLALQKTKMELAVAENVLSASSDLAIAEEKLAAAQKCRQQGEQLAQLHREQRRAATVIARAEEIMAATATLDKTWELIATYEEKRRQLERIEGLYREQVQLRQKIRQAEKALVKFKAQLQDLAAQYRTLLLKLGKCPLCLTDVTPIVLDRILAEYDEGGIKGNGL
ncbi:MAG: AAA family ATPase [bacterium]|jgi:exonuclease SbcC